MPTLTAPHWPSLGTKQLVADGQFRFWLKSKDTSEVLVPGPSHRDGPFEYEFWLNKSKKLVGYRFEFEHGITSIGPGSLEPQQFPQKVATLPRLQRFSSSVLATYVPFELAPHTGTGDMLVLYHDLCVRLIRYLTPVGPTYCVLVRSKLESH